MVEEIWVNLNEGAQATGYNHQYVQRLAIKMSKKPEAEREIRLRWRTSYWEMWLPDLITYINSKSERGPRKKRKPKEETSS
jgi:hypothetical protein